MASKAFTLLVVVIGSLQTITASPIVSAETADQLSLTFRNSVAQAIRENLERQQLNNIGSQTTIQFVGPRSNGNHQAAPELPALPALHTVLPTEIAVDAPTIVAAAPVQYTPAEPTADNDIDTNIPADLPDEAEQAKNAHYSFDSSVKDTINGHSHTRQETRDGLSLSGSYSYNDGFFQRTVHYEADENGYRVTKEEIEPVGDGPQYNPAGTADVSSSLIGSYSITANDFKTSTTAERLLDGDQ